MILRPDLARTMQAIRAQRATTHPTLPHPCQCSRPVKDDGTCIHCGKGLP
jgi:hypothetical protein